MKKLLSLVLMIGLSYSVAAMNEQRAGTPRKDRRPQMCCFGKTIFTGQLILFLYQIGNLQIDSNKKYENIAELGKQIDYFEQQNGSHIGELYGQIPSAFFSDPMKNPATEWGECSKKGKSAWQATIAQYKKATCPKNYKYKNYPNKPKKQRWR